MIDEVWRYDEISYMKRLPRFDGIYILQSAIGLPEIMRSLDKYLAALAQKYRNFWMHIREQAVMVLMWMAQKDCVDFRGIVDIETPYCR